MWFRWSDADLEFEEFSEGDVWIACLLLSIFVGLCVLLLGMNWVTSQMQKEEQERMLDHLTVSPLASDLNEQCWFARRRSRGSLSLDESDHQSSDDDLKSSHGTATLRRIPESKDLDEGGGDDPLSHSCSQAMLQRSIVAKSKRRNRPNSAPSRKKSKNN